MTFEERLRKAKELAYKLKQPLALKDILGDDEEDNGDSSSDDKDNQGDGNAN